jgi:sulfopyruvate decarboxylase subunit alpha
MMSSEQLLHGAGIIDALKKACISHVVSVPDLTTSEGVLRPLGSDTELKLLRVCREEEGVGICAGLAMAGRRGAMLIQYTGFLASMNAIRAIAMEYRQPICMLVGMLFTDSPEDPSKSRNYGVSRIIPLLQAIGLRYHIVACDGDVPVVAPALARAFDESEPVVILITRYPSP